MGLASGARLGSYEVLGPLGAGGMGEVFRARDTKLGREVALKLLPEDVASSPDRLSRLEREARTLASLHHPHVATLFAFEEHDSRRFLVMELVPGETLAERIARGPLPLREALGLFRQIAEGLEAAHEKGIVHRDLKPANIKITPDGQAKVLDFGLAKSVEPTWGPISSELPTESHSGTAAGVIVGTAAYMSPEQARGLPVNKRTDVWAFGACLHEALSGRRAFGGTTMTDVLAEVLEREPDWNALPKETPPTIRRLLRRCLRKNPGERLHDIADARLELEDAGEASSSASSGGPPPPAPVRTMGMWRAVAGLMTVVAALALGWGLHPSPTPTRAVRHVQVPAPYLSLPNECTITISRDGTRLAYVGDREGVRQVYVRALDSPESKPLPGTENGLCPFFAPDGQSIGFWADRKLKTISLSGGSAVALYDAPLDPNLGVLPLKASWGADGRILFASLQAGGRGVVMRIRASGGTPERLAEADVKKGEYYLYQPELLPDGETLLFTAAKAGFGLGSEVVVQSSKTGQRRKIVDGASSAHYVHTGHLVYEQAGKLMAAPFDPRRLELAGAPVALVEGLSTWAMPQGADYALSDDGTLASLPRFEQALGTTLVWVDRGGREQPVTTTRHLFNGAQLSPDGRKLAMWLGDDGQVWVLDIERGLLSRVTTEDKSYSYWNVWSPDGRRLVFNSVRPDSPGTSLFWQVADGSRPAERLTTTDLLQQPRGFSPDGSLLVFQEQHPETGYDIGVLPMGKDEEPRPLLKTRFNEFQPRLSPDGRWLAYVSDESGRDEVYVRPFPSMDGKWQVSTEGGLEPAWARDGRELFYRTTRSPYLGSTLMAVSVSTAGGFRADVPRRLFEGPYDITPVYGQCYDVAADGRFVMIKFEPAKAPTHVEVVLNWWVELKQKLGERK